MEQVNNNAIIKRIASLMTQLSKAFDEENLTNKLKVGLTAPLDKLHCLVLIADIYECVHLFMASRESRLSDYFGGFTLRQCLEYVRDIDKFKQDLKDASVAAGSSVADEDLRFFTERFRLLCEKGVDALCVDEDNNEIPSSGKSTLWKAKPNAQNGKKTSFGRVFNDSKEKLDDESDVLKSADPNDSDSLKAAESQLLSKWTAYKADALDEQCTKEGKNLFPDTIFRIQEEVAKNSTEDIRQELMKALEFLRNAFMIDAEDIHYIRTGNFDALNGVYSQVIIDKYYTQLPLKDYYDLKSRFIEDVVEEDDTLLSDWREKRGYVNCALSDMQWNEFQQWREESIIDYMRGQNELWKIRMHSGGLDTSVTPENFARMFYRRKDVNIYFIRSQWELEELPEVITRLKKMKNNEQKHKELTPEQKDVDDFINMINTLAENAYERWNGKMIIPAVHRPEVEVVIKKKQLAEFLNSQRINDFDKLLSVCEPSSNVNLRICKYVVELKNATYFGALPKKELAKLLAPLLGMSEGAVNNYLSSN